MLLIQKRKYPSRPPTTSNEVPAEEGHISRAGVIGIARNLHDGDFHQVVRSSTSTSTTPVQSIAENHFLYHRMQRTTEKCCMTNATSV